MGKFMYAVIETGGKQYRVTEGEIVPVDRIEQAKESKVSFDKVLLIADGANVTLGQPYVQGAKVSGTLVDEQKDEKVTIIKFKPKTGYKKKQGHRQIYSLVKIEKINK